MIPKLLTKRRGIKSKNYATIEQEPLKKLFVRVKENDVRALNELKKRLAPSIGKKIKILLADNPDLNLSKEELWEEAELAIINATRYNTKTKRNHQILIDSSIRNAFRTLINAKKSKNISQYLFPKRLLDISKHQHLLALLPENRRKVIELGAQGYSKQEIGKQLNVTRERIRQLELSGLIKLSKWKRFETLRPEEIEIERTKANKAISGILTKEELPIVIRHINDLAHDIFRKPAAQKEKNLLNSGMQKIKTKRLFDEFMILLELSRK